MEKKNISHIKGFVFDMDGTVYLGGRIIPGAVELIDYLAKKDIPYRYFTNNSSKNAEVYEKRLLSMGFSDPSGKVMISNAVAIEYIKENYPDKTVFVMGTEFLVSDFINSGISVVQSVDADIAVLGFDTTLEYERLCAFCDLVRSGAPYFGVNPDLNCPTETGFIPDCGSMAELIRASTGYYPTFFGKPSPLTLKYIVEQMGIEEESLAIVGDRLYTDIAIGREGKINTVLVLSGETKRADLENSDINPTFIFDSVKEILEALKNG